RLPLRFVLTPDLTLAPRAAVLAPATVRRDFVRAIDLIAHRETSPALPQYLHLSDLEDGGEIEVEVTAILRRPPLDDRLRLLPRVLEVLGSQLTKTATTIDGVLARCHGHEQANLHHAPPMSSLKPLGPQPPAPAGSAPRAS